MFQKLKWSWALMGVTFVIGAVALTLIDPNTQVAVHWNSAGEIDDTASPAFAFFIIPFVQFLTVGIFSSLKFLEPRQKNLQQSGKAIQAIAGALTGLLLVVQAMIIGQAMGLEFTRLNMLFGGMGIMLAVVGNYFGKLRSSFFIGIRTPWTLSSESVWQQTHRLAGKLFMLAGVLLFAASLILEKQHLSAAMLIVVLPAALIPAIYSWFLYRQEQAAEHKLGQKTDQPEA